MTDVNNNILEGHYSCETKIKRPAMTVADAPAALPKHALFSEKEAKQRMKALNADIYEATKKEKSKNEFNTSLYFKIFGGVGIAAAGIAGISKIRGGINGK